MIGNVTLTTPDDEVTTQYQNNIGSNRAKIRELHKVSGGKLLLEDASISALHKFTGYSELRIFCYKPSHGRTVDVAITLDEEIFEMMQGIVSGNTFDYCSKTYKKLENDNSLLLSQSCGNLNGDNRGSVFTGFNGAVIFKGFYYHIFLINGRTECDDWISSSGTWAYYVR